MSKFVCLQDFETYALNNLCRNAADYFKSGANHEHTLRENRGAFNRLKIRPRCLRDVSHRNLKTTVLGNEISYPIGVAPTAMQKLAHPDGEMATAKATASEGTVMILSTLSTTSLEDVMGAAPHGLKWFQLYIYSDRNVTSQLVTRVEKAGYKALVLTVNTPIFGNRLADSRNKFVLPPHLRLPNFEMDDIKSSGLGKEDVMDYLESLLDPSLTWKDVLWLKSITTLPIVVKGILTAEDALLAKEHGASAILVCNHGARQLDCVPATIEALPEIVRAVKGELEVYLDGGVQTGTDVLMALALGARAVFIGRPILYGLTHNGEVGAKQVLEIIKKELDVAMALSGFSSVDEIDSSAVVRKEFYAKL